jgi:hypothetical protein
MGTETADARLLEPGKPLPEEIADWRALGLVSVRRDRADPNAHMTHERATLERCTNFLSSSECVHEASTSKPFGQ